MISPLPEKILLGKTLQISRVLTGLWQVADIEKSGKIIDPENGALEPAYRVKGDGIIWCYSPIAKTMVRILRGSKAYLLQEITNENEETMIFVPYEVVYINKEELIEIGYN